jgi:hypothetical protein
MPTGPWHPYDWPDDTLPLGGFTAEPYVFHALDLATWVTKGDNCPKCNTLSGRTYSLAYWQATVMPGWHNHCDCKLVLSKRGVRESPHNLWGTEPYWWNPQMSIGDYLVQTLNRFLNFFNGRQDLLKMNGDAYSGFDNLNPIIKSNSAYTSAPWTMMPETTPADWFPFVKVYNDFCQIANNKLWLFSFIGICGNPAALLNQGIQNPFAKLPNETSNQALPNPKNPKNPIILTPSPEYTPPEEDPYPYWY